MDTVKLLNFLSSVNLYVESISGAVSTGSGDFTVAGSFAMAFLFDEVLSSVGDSVKIDLTGEMKNDASSETNVRVIAGGLSVSNSNLGVGAVLSFLYDEDEVRSEVGNGADIKAGGDYHQSASSKTDILDITVAGAATGSSGEATVGANLGAVVLLTKADAEVKDSAAIKADGNLDILSTQDNDTVLVAASVALTMGGIAGAGTLNVTVSDSEANITVGDGVTLTSGKDMALKADTTERLISVLASASASNGKEAASGVVSVLVDNAQTQVVLGKVKATATGNVTITADSNTRLYQINAAISVGNTAAVGAAVVVNVLGRSVLVKIANGAQITATKGNVLIQTTGDEKVLLVLGSAAASLNNSATGLIPVIVSNSKVRTLAGIEEVEGEYQGGTQANHLKVTAGDSIGVIADLQSNVVIVAGGIAVGSNGVGVNLDTAVFKNTIDSIVGDWAELIAGGITVAQGVTTGIQTPNREERRHGVILSATGREDITLVSVAAAGGLENAVSGVVNTLVVSNKTNAAAREHVTMTAKAVSGSSDDDCSHPEVTVEADDDVNVFSKEVNATAADSVVINTPGDVNVTATADDDVVLFALGLGASGTVGVAASANALVFQNKTHAILGGTVGSQNSRVRNVTVKAGALAASFNQMAESLQQSEQRRSSHTSTMRHSAM